MSDTFTEELREYLKTEKEALKEKQLTNFWVLCDTDVFKPIKNLSEQQVEQILMDDPDKYGKRKIANIRIAFNISKKYANIFYISFVIVVMNISSKGELKTSNQKTLCINYNAIDIKIRKFKMSDVKRFLKLCKNGILNSDTMNGIYLKNALEKLEKKNILLDEV
jgi:phage pi2 protein 07